MPKFNMNVRHKNYLFITWTPIFGKVNKNVEFIYLRNRNSNIFHFMAATRSSALMNEALNINIGFCFT